MATIQAPVENIDAGTGDVVRTWSDVGTEYMSLEAVTAAERLSFDRMDATVTHRARMWNHSAVRMNYRLLWNGRTFHITSITEPDLVSIELLLEEKQEP